MERHPLPGETLLGNSITLLPGGKGANQALAAARLGATVCLIGAVGSDSTAALATEHLEASEVDISAVRAVHGPTGLALIYIAGDDENTIVVIPGANSAVDAICRRPQRPVSRPANKGRFINYQPGVISPPQPPSQPAWRSSTRSATGPGRSR
ncbi:PfkB family carbohydrate kinase [Pseudarthrobacter sp. N5]|uniref:PfkB family carbohydrate kinase n=1 Tax=Pseudarthrobacter sp. N5 TaxID=3418416 RepID=UPI003CEC3694